MKQEEKKPIPWEAVDPKPPVVHSGHMENRTQPSLEVRQGAPIGAPILFVSSSRSCCRSGHCCSNRRCCRSSS